jgi:hypothetical protein
MNLHAINGAPINGGVGVRLISAAAAFVCNVSINANPTRTTPANASARGTVSINTNPTRTTFAGSTLNGQVHVLVVPTLIKTAAAAVNTSAEIKAFVLRVVQAEANITGFGSMTAIPASVLGRADVAASATVLADATKVQPGRADGLCVAELAVFAKVTRYVRASITATAKVRPEASVNGVHDAAAAITASAEISHADFGGVIRYVEAEMDCRAETVAVGTTEQPGEAHALAVSGGSVEPSVIPGGAAKIGGSVQFTAEATRSVDAESHIVAACILQAYGGQRHEGIATLNASATVISIATREVLPTASLYCYSELGVGVERIQFATAEMQLGTADFAADAFTNAESFDPPDRTLYRPMTNRELRRTFINREMRKAA